MYILDTIGLTVDLNLSMTITVAIRMLPNMRVRVCVYGGEQTNRLITFFLNQESAQMLSCRGG